jgi:hypothetical protein
MRQSPAEPAMLWGRESNTKVMWKLHQGLFDD